MDEIQIVVERDGYGPRKWRWRLANECGLTIGLGVGFSRSRERLCFGTAAAAGSANRNGS